MATIRILLGIICFIAIGGSWHPCRPFVTTLSLHKHFICDDVQNPAVLKVLAIASAEAGVREQTGKNDGLKVEQYLAYVKLKKGAPWCAAFVSWVYGRAGYARPRTGWSPALFPGSRLTDQIKPACVFGIYFSDLKRIAHCGLVVKRAGGWVLTIEGNTNISGSREGDGVYRKRRHIKTIKAFADWIN